MEYQTKRNLRSNLFLVQNTIKQLVSGGFSYFLGGFKQYQLVTASLRLFQVAPHFSKNLLQLYFEILVLALQNTFEVSKKVSIWRLKKSQNNDKLLCKSMSSSYNMEQKTLMEEWRKRFMQLLHLRVCESFNFGQSNETCGVLWSI